LIETPARAARAFEEYFSGYCERAALILQKTFEQTEGYDEMIVLRGIRLSPAECWGASGPIRRRGKSSSPWLTDAEFGICVPEIVPAR
jgi:hypothetical protein